jgi:hypothetical protein
VGVTGHRSERLADAVDAELRAQIRDVLRNVRRDALEIANGGFFGYAGDPQLRVISPLAEGADRIVAEEALGLGFELQCPLPFPIEEYKRDFATEESRQQFDALLARASAVMILNGHDQASVRKEIAYERVGRMVIRQCDILIAVWDGGEPVRRGGTAQIAREAIADDIPVVRIPVVPPHNPEVIDVQAPSTDPPYETLRRALDRLLLPPPPTETAKRYFGPPPVLAPPPLYRWLVSLTGGRPREDVVESVPAALDTALPAELEWAGALADHYAAAYRSGFVANYLLGAVAVLMALLGFLPSNGWARWTELIVIAAIITITVWGRRSAWHERWLHYRLLVEQLRQMRFLHPLGRVTPSFRVPAHLADVDPRRLWVSWLFRARVRERGMATGDLGGRNGERQRTALRREIDGQAAYHGRLALRFQAVARRLHAAGLFLFGLTLLICLAHLFEHPVHEWMADLGLRWPGVASIGYWSTALAAFLPALGAALKGIESQGEFARLARRSLGMAAALTTAATRLPSADDPEADDVADIAESVAAIMTDEVLDWQALFRGKPLTLPT